MTYFSQDNNCHIYIHCGQCTTQEQVLQLNLAPITKEYFEDHLRNNYCIILAYLSEIAYLPDEMPCFECMNSSVKFCDQIAKTTFKHLFNKRALRNEDYLSTRNYFYITCGREKIQM